MEPDENIFGDLDVDDVLDPPVVKDQFKEQIKGIKCDEPLWFLEPDDNELRKKIGESKSRLEDTVITRGAYYYRKKDYQASLECWLKVQAMHSNPKDVRFEEVDGIVRCHLKLGNIEEAWTNVQRLVQIAPNDCSAWLLHGIVRSEAKDPLKLQLYSHLKSLIGLHNHLEGLIKTAYLYKELNKPQIVKYLVSRALISTHQTSIPSMYSQTMTSLQELEQWATENQSDGEAPGNNEFLSFPDDQELSHLEEQVFGPNFNKIHNIQSLQSSLHELDMSEIRDPSRM